MATKHGQTSYRHDDYKVQREFERISKDIAEVKSSNENSLPPRSDTGTGQDNKWALTAKHNNNPVPPVKVIQGLNFKDTTISQAELEPVLFEVTTVPLENAYSFGLISGNNGKFSQANIRAWSQKQVISGFIEINRLPDDSPTYELEEAWKREGRHHKPANNYFGWYVYNYIDHGWLLDDPNDFLITLIDTHKISVGSLDAEILKDEIETYLYELGINPDTQPEEAYDAIRFYYQNVYPSIKNMIPQMFIAETEGKRITELGIPKDIIIIRGLYKPGIQPYMGGVYTPGNIDYLDDDHKLVRTNVIYHYVVRRK